MLDLNTDRLSHFGIRAYTAGNFHTLTIFEIRTYESSLPSPSLSIVFEDASISRPIYPTNANPTKSLLRSGGQSLGRREQNDRLRYRQQSMNWFVDTSIMPVLHCAKNPCK